MKKRILLAVLSIIFISLSGHGSTAVDTASPYNDAIKLRGLLNGKNIFNTNDANTIKIIATILQPYLIKQEKEDTDAKSIIENFTISTSPDFNPFLSPYFDLSSAQGGKNGVSVLGANEFLSRSIGGLDVTNITKGLAMFMIQRAKQELNIAFFDQFKRFVEKNPEMKIMFPKTSEALANLLSYNYPTMISTLRGKFEEDLAALPIHFEEIFNLPQYQDLLKQYPAIKVVVKSIPLIYKLGNGACAPIDIIKDFADFPEWAEAPGDSAFQNTGNAIKLAGIFSESLRINIGKDSSGWVSYNRFNKEIIKDANTQKIYFGLVFGMINKERIKFDASFLADLIRKNTALISGVTLYQDRLLNISETIADEIKEINNIRSKGGKPSLENYRRYISSGIDAVELGLDIATYFNKTVKIYPDYIIIFRNVNELYKNIYTKQYTPAIINSITIIDKTITLIGDKIKKGKDKAINDNLAKVTTFQNRLTDLSRYGVFMANMSEAQTPEEVQNAIEAAALPVGSSVIKKYSDFNISLQSYLGVYCLFNKSTSSTVNMWNNSFGITAPIGVSFSYGLRNWGSLTLFGSLIDIGAIVDYDLKTTPDTTNKTTTTTKDYKIELGQIFSPGVYIVYGAGLKLPLSLGIGAQYGPGLGKIDNGQTIINNPSWRFNVFLCVDIPMFNLFSKTWHPWKHCVGKGN